MIASIHWFQSALIVFLHSILICWSCSTTFKLFHTFQGTITNLYIVPSLCILIPTHDHVINCISSIYQPTNAHIISHKTLLKHFKTLRHVSILSDHHQGALFLAKVMLQYSQFNSYLQTRCCGSIPCCVVSHYSAYEAHWATAPQHIPTQHDMLPQHLICKYQLNCEYCNITLARN